MTTTDPSESTSYADRSAANHDETPRILVQGDAEVVQQITVPTNASVERIIGKQVIHQPFTPRLIAASAEERAAAAAQMAALPTDTLPDPIDTLPPGSWMHSLSRNRQFVGREADLLALAALLKGGQAVAVNQAQSAVICGIGGIGKTQLAVEFVYRYGRYFAGVFWLSFAQADTIGAEIARCGGAGHLQLFTETAGLKLGEQASLVRDRWACGLPYLLIFDNCENPDLVRVHHPGGAARVLITSRTPDWPGDLGVQRLLLGVLRREESITLLHRHRPDLSDADVDALAAELGDLPLALHLAGRFMARFVRVLTPEQYLAELQSPRIFERMPLREQDGTLPTGHSRDVARTFALSYERLDPQDAEDALTLRLLARAAHLALGEVVPAALLHAMLEPRGDNLDAALVVESAVERLVGLGLVERDGTAGLRMHRLVGAYVRQASNDALAQQAAEQTLLATSNGLNQHCVPTLLPQLQPHLRHMIQAVATRQDVAVARLQASFGEHLYLLGSTQEAYHFYERAQTIAEVVLGSNHEETLRMRDRLATLLKDLAKFNEAYKVSRESLTRRERCSTSNPSDIANNLHQIAEILQGLGDYTKARVHYERALELHARHLGTTHHLTLTTLTSLSILVSLIDPPAAEDLFARAREIEQRLLAEPSDTMLVGLAMVRAIFLALLRKDVATAERLSDSARVIYHHLIATEHQDIPHDLRQLILVARPEDSYGDDGIEDLLVRIFGELHPRTALGLMVLGMIAHMGGERAEARRLYGRALHIQQDLHREDHPETAQLIWWRGILLAESGQRDSARAQLRWAVNIYTNVLSAAHPTTRRCRSDLDKLNQQPRGKRYMPKQSRPRQRKMSKRVNSRRS